MPAVINPTITDAGLSAAVTAQGNGVQVSITHISLGAGEYDPVGNETALLDLKETVTIGSGGVVDNGASITVNVRFPPYEDAPYAAKEIGFYIGDPDDGGILFAVYSSSTDVNGIVQRSSLDFVAQFVLGLSRVPAGSVNVSVDPAMAALFMMIQDHAEEADPHPSYMKSSAITGAVLAFARPTPPPGWLNCNGQLVSRATYSDLFAAIGTTFGEGDGASTFALPDLRGEFIRGFDAARGVDPGRTFGSHQDSRMQNHYHGTGDFRNETNDDWFAILREWVGTFSSRWVAGESNARQIATISGGSGGTRYTATSDQMPVAGSETRPRNVALIYCIKT